MSSLILENILNRSSQKINFDLTKSIASNNFQDNNFNKMPISVKKNDWELIETQNSSFLTKEYIFNSNKHMIYFITETLKYANEIDHYPELVITKDKIDVKLMTEQINDVTDLDMALLNHIKDLYEDIKFIG